MQTLKSLIDKASDVCGSDSELARRLECSRQFVSQMKKKPNTIPPEMAGLIAEIAGEEIAPAVLAAVMEQMTKTPRGQKVREAMERAFLAGAAATLATLTTAANAKTDTILSSADLTNYASYGFALLRRLLGISPATKNHSFHRSSLAVLTN